MFPILMVVTAFLIGGVAATPAITFADQHTLPKCNYLHGGFPASALNVIEPAAHVPPSLAALAGVWEGEWHSLVNPDLAPSPSVLSVWGVSDRYAIAVYSFEGLVRFALPMHLQSDGTLRQFTFTGPFVWSLSEDRETLHGEILFRYGPATANIDMHRCLP